MWLPDLLLSDITARSAETHGLKRLKVGVLFKVGESSENFTVFQGPKDTCPDQSERLSPPAPIRRYQLDQLGRTSASGVKVKQSRYRPGVAQRVPGS